MADLAQGNNCLSVHSDEWGPSATPPRMQALPAAATVSIVQPNKSTVTRKLSLAMRADIVSMG